MDDSGTVESMCRRLAAVLALVLTALVCVPQTAAAGRTHGVRVVDPHAPYPEGPLWRDGRLYYTDYANSNVLVLRHDHKSVFWHRDGCGASGLVSLPRRHLLVTCYDDNTLVELGPRGRAVRTIGRDGDGRPFLGPNDLARDAHGGVYFSASGVYDVDAPVQGTVDYMSRSGRIRQVATHIHYSNGLAVTPDGRHLLVSEMLENRVLAYDIGPDGTLSGRRVLVRMRDITPGPPPSDPYTGPDGLKIGQDGLVYVAENGTGRVVVADLSGRLVRSVRVPAKYLTNVTLTPWGEMYITAAFDANHAPYPGAVYAAW